MAPGAVVLVIIIVGVVLVLIISAARSSNRSPRPPQQPRVSNSSGLFAEPHSAGRPTSNASARAPAAVPTTSGNGRTLTYLLQGHVPKQGWVIAQKSSGQLSGFGTITATDDELPEFAKAVIKPFDDGKRTMRVVFFRGTLNPDDLTIDKAYGDVTPHQGGGFSPWIFMG